VTNSVPDNYSQCAQRQQYLEPGLLPLVWVDYTKDTLEPVTLIPIKNESCTINRLFLLFFGHLFCNSTNYLILHLIFQTGIFKEYYVLRITFYMNLQLTLSNTRHHLTTKPTTTSPPTMHLL